MTDLLLLLHTNILHTNTEKKRRAYLIDQLNSDITTMLWEYTSCISSC